MHTRRQEQRAAAARGSQTRRRRRRRRRRPAAARLWRTCRSCGRKPSPRSWLAAGVPTKPARSAGAKKRAGLHGPCHGPGPPRGAESTHLEPLQQHGVAKRLSAGRWTPRATPCGRRCGWAAGVGLGQRRQGDGRSAEVVRRHGGSKRNPERGPSKPRTCDAASKHTNSTAVRNVQQQSTGRPSSSLELTWPNECRWCRHLEPCRPPSVHGSPSSNVN